MPNERVLGIKRKKTGTETVNLRNPAIVFSNRIGNLITQLVDANNYLDREQVSNSRLGLKKTRDRTMGNIVQNRYVNTAIGHTSGSISPDMDSLVLSVALYLHSRNEMATEEVARTCEFLARPVIFATEIGEKLLRNDGDAYENGVWPEVNRFLISVNAKYVQFGNGHKSFLKYLGRTSPPEESVVKRTLVKTKPKLEVIKKLIKFFEKK